jgi:hypothetical protein
MKIQNFEKDLEKEVVEWVKKGGMVVLRELDEHLPLIVIRFRQAIYDHAKIAGDFEMMLWLETKFSDLKPEPLENRIS